MHTFLNFCDHTEAVMNGDIPLCLIADASLFDSLNN